MKSKALAGVLRSLRMYHGDRAREAAMDRLYARYLATGDVAFDIGTDIRRVASQGYGILALQAATSGTGINELVGHVVAFSLLARTTTPWPLPPGCRVLLVSLDEYRHWFASRRADLLAIAACAADQLDWSALVRDARAAHVSAHVRLALRYANRTLDLPVLQLAYDRFTAAATMPVA